MAKITVRAKIQERFSSDGTPAKRYIKLPTFTRSHCDMQAFRRHPRYGAYANSDVFLGILARIRSEIASDRGILNLAKCPQNVSVDESKFLAVVSIEV